MELDNDVEMALREMKENNSVLNGETIEISADDSYDKLESVPMELRTELVSFVQEKLYSRFVLSLSDLKRLFNVKLSSLPPGHILGKGMSDKLFEQTVIEVGGISLNAKVSWPLICSIKPNKSECYLKDSFCQVSIRHNLWVLIRSTLPIKGSFLSIFH